MAKHFQLGGDLGLTLEGYIDMGLKEAMKGKCILCGDAPHQAGICASDGSEKSRKMMNTPEGEFSHRLAFFALCEICQGDPNANDKVQSKILQSVRQLNDRATGSARLTDDQTFNL